MISSALFREDNYSPCKLDMSQAYQQILLEDEAKTYLTINTHRDPFRYKRLPVGVSSAPAIFKELWTVCYRIYHMSLSHLTEMCILGFDQSQEVIFQQ